MKQFRFTALALASLAALAACSENPAGPAPDAITVKPVTASAVTTTVTTFCSDNTWTNAHVLTPDPFWIDNNAVIGTPDGFSVNSQWIGPGDNAGFTWTLGDLWTVSKTIPLPADAINVSIAGKVSVDNDVQIDVNGNYFFCSFAGTCGTTDPRPSYPQPPPNEPSNTVPNINPGHMPFSATSGFGTSNVITFGVYNDYALDATNHNNPSGVDFCFTVTYDEPIVVTSNQGCTLGYWKNHTKAGQWPTGFLPGEKFSDAFGGSTLFGTKTLLQVLQTGGGGVINFGRQAVTAMLNAASGMSGFPETTTQVLADFNTAVAGGASTEATQATAWEMETDANPNGLISCPLNGGTFTTL